MKGQHVTPAPERSIGPLFDSPRRVLTRADQIFQRFKGFHRENPDIWIMFQRFALDVVARGFKRYSAYSIFERIRWHVDIETSGAGGVKINNDFRPYYSRMFTVIHPELQDFFEVRIRTSATRPAFDEDIAVFHVGCPHAEDGLNMELKALAKEGGQ